jgi:hypothetical protein
MTALRQGYLNGIGGLNLKVSAIITNLEIFSLRKKMIKW